MSTSLLFSVVFSRNSTRKEILLHMYLVSFNALRSQLNFVPYPRKISRESCCLVKLVFMKHQVIMLS